MKKSEKGFVATSLLYSFFLVFIALIMILINSYIGNKTIIDRFNEKVEDELNGKDITIRMRVKNAIITYGSEILENRVQNGNFTSSGSSIPSWTSVNASRDTSVSQLGKYGASGSYYYQKIDKMINGHIYFYGITYKQNHNYELSSYVNGIDGTSVNYLTQIIKTKNTNEKYIKAGTIFKMNGTGDVNLILGYGNNPEVANVTEFRNVILMDLTDIYSNNNIPDLKYLLDNIDYFDATVYFIKREWHEGTDPVEVEMEAYGTSANAKIDTSRSSCIYPDSTTYQLGPIKDADYKRTYNSETDKYTTKIKLQFKDMKDDISCSIVWGL